jgi:P-type Cu+ transporter
MEEDAALALTAAVEHHSEHPIAAAVVAEAKARGLTLPEVTEIEAEPGFGIQGQVGEQRIAVGARRWMERLAVPLDAASEVAERLGAEGQTPIYVAADQRLIAVLAVADPIKAGSREAIAQLRALGLEVGDADR